MFDLNWAELILIGFVALIVIGPEDLPDMFRQLGRFTAKLRQMSREFSRAMEEAAKQSGMKDAADDLRSATSVKSLGLDAVREAADKFEKWDPIKNAAKPSMTQAVTMPARSLIPPPIPETPVAVDDAAEAADDLAHMADDPMANVLMADPTIHGPATQALLDKQALRAQVLKEQTEKLQAIEAGTYVPTPPVPVAALVVEPKPAAQPAPVEPAAEANIVQAPAADVVAIAENPPLENATAETTTHETPKKADHA